MGLHERRCREKEIRRQRIAVAARHMFLKKGFEETTIRDIAKEAELGASTIYLYFNTKEEIFVSFAVSLLQCLEAKIDYVSKETNGSINDKFRNLKNALLEAYDIDPASLTGMLKLQSREKLQDISSTILSEFQDLIENIIRKIAGILDKGVKAGVFPNQNTAMLSNILWGIFSGIVLRQVHPPNGIGEGSVRPAFERAFTLFIKGLEAEKSDHRSLTHWQ